MADDKPEENLEQPEEELQEDVKPEESVDESATEQPEEEAPEEPEQQEEETPASAEEQGEEQTPPQMSRRKAKRLEKLEGLVERLRGPATPKTQSSGIDYRQMIQADDEVYKQLEDRSQEFGQAQYNAGLEQAKSIQFHTRLEIDAPRIESKYPQFDKNSSEFNPATANAVNEWYLASVGYDARTNTVQNPDLRYADFVEGVMELADNMAGVKTAKATQNIAKQAATTGLRPDGSSPKRMDLSKAPEDMTDEELKAATAASMPRDIRGRFIPTK